MLKAFAQNGDIALRPKTTIFAVAEKAFTPQNQINCSGLRQRRATVCSLATWFALLAAAGRGDAAPCALLPVTTWYNTVFAGTYRLEFDLHDPPGPHPYRWLADAGMRIKHPDGTSCTASPDVAIVTAQIYIAAGHYLYIGTYEGSDQKLYLVDARNCAILWQSPDLYGLGFGRTKTGFYLPNVGWLAIRPDCLPGKISGKPLPPLMAPP